MDKFIIEGKTPLKGTIAVSGSKNAALPLMAASLLAEGPVKLTNIPILDDIHTFNKVIKETGCKVEFNHADRSILFDASGVTQYIAPYELVRKMRASFYMLGALVGRYGYAKVSLPGGCAWGPRPVNLHLEALKAIGVKIKMDNGYVIAEAPPSGIPGGEFTFNPRSVGATVNVILAAVLAKGKTVLHNVAQEPDVVQLCQALAQMGADIQGIGKSKLTINGVNSLKGQTLRNAPDRIETGTYMLAGIMNPDSHVTITNTDPDDLGHFLEQFEQTGALMNISGTTITVKAPEIIQPVSITTDVYPGFPTDLQAQWATVMTLADGKSVITDTIYTDRFSYVPELGRLGAQLDVKLNSVHVNGNSQLTSASIMSTDLRASVSLVMAAMNAEGTSEVLRVYHLDRGYEFLETKLNAIGAKITRAKE
ncbi:UDP-N-acetylglucosamine 1-carboxyvinyltransferase [bacterium]|nr:MAG: UDP-N-acetylglucosamine 1-carboxyvinyltransferase [bacterium]